jgi:hypothetical protein
MGPPNHSQSGMAPLDYTKSQNEVKANKERDMVTTASTELSGRQFLAAAGLPAATSWLAPSALFAQSDDVLIAGHRKQQ